MSLTLSDTRSPETVAVPEDEQVLRFPLSSAQERCWFINALDPGTTALNVALRWELRGRFDASLIERAFGRVIERHEALRTRIVEQDGVAEQEVLPPFRPVLAEIDLQTFPEARRDAEVLRLGRVEAHKPFDPGQLPLLRLTLLRLAPDRAILLLTIHQIAFDGWSIRLISAEFGAAAAALNAGTRPDLPDLPLQYGDYASWQRAYLSSGRFEREVAYWKAQVGGASYFEVPGDHPRGERPTSNGEILAELLPDAITDAMDRKVRAEGVTTFGFGCAVIAALLHKVTGAQDVIVGTQIAGRNDPDLEPLIGVFINNLVLRFDLSGDPSFHDLLGRANRTVQDALIHQAMPFHRLVEILRPPRDPSRMPLISVNFTVLQDVMENARYGDLEVVGHPSLSAGSLYDLNFFMVHWPTGWRMALEYNSDLFDRSTGESLLRLWRDSLVRAVGEGDLALSDLVPAASPRAAARPVPVEVAMPQRMAPPSPQAGSSAAGTEAERTVLRIWREVLDKPSIGPDADFFESGGHSLLALRMLARVGEALGRRVNVAALFAAPTAGAFARALVEDAPQLRAWNVVPIQPHGAKTPVIVINNTILYYELGKALGPDRPLVAIQLFDPHEGSAPDDASFEALCGRYEALVRSARPHGPYVLMGLCVAGCIAYEVARRLRAAGEEVPLVVMADTWRPGFIDGLPPFRSLLFGMGYRWHVAMHHLRMLRAGRTTLMSVLHTYPRIRRSGLFRWLEAKRGEGEILGKEDWSNRWFLPTLERLRDRYVVGPTSGTLALVQSEETHIPFADARMGWAPFARGGLVRRRVAGWHADMFKEPGARAMAEFLDPLLADVDAGRATVAR